MRFAVFDGPKVSVPGALLKKDCIEAGQIWNEAGERLDGGIWILPFQIRNEWEVVGNKK